MATQFSDWRPLQPSNRVVWRSVPTSARPLAGPFFPGMAHAQSLGWLYWAPLASPGIAKVWQPSMVVPNQEAPMNWDRVEGDWKQLTGKIKEQWGKLTADDITPINGRRDQLEGKLQER